MLPALVAEGRRILIFSQFASVPALIEEALPPLNIPYVELSGSTRDRAHRIGQEQPVLVYKLIAESTVEERMAELQARKQTLADAMLEIGTNAGLNLSADDLQALFAPLV
ncbi:MAG TPA: DEAD/DEAH box helicase [Gammaproteobacteria bacterium]|nr:DEAD/DEAH box helicase [Gammaproteobacteria bacterium]